MTDRPNEKRLVVHCKRESYDVYIGRPSKWGNPFTLEQFGGDRDYCLEVYRSWLMDDLRGPLRMQAKLELRGKVLGCWCAPQKCHGDILAEVANG